jgi:potassium efflux system protein
VGLGFGLKEIFANFFSGLIILFERPVRIGDTVTIGDVSGTVARIRIRSTTITDWDNKELVIPNQNLVVEPLINWTLSDQITRITFKVGIAYGPEIERAHRLMSDTVAAHPLVLPEPSSTVLFTGFGDSALEFQVRAFVKEQAQRLQVIHELHMDLAKALAAGGIEIPFPQRDLHLRSLPPELRPKPPPG